MQNYAIKINNLTKTYKSKTALNDVTLSLEKGKIYGFIGRNGAGKTTLIRILTGLSFPDKGSIEILGSSDRKGLENSRKSIGCMVEHTGLHQNYTARQNITLQCKFMGIKNELEIDRVLKIVGLENSGNKKYKDFSMGMKQRLGIAAALLGSPKILILDEPINGLDPVGIAEIREILLELNKYKKITILISSHILTELYMLATNYLILDEGVIVKNLTIEELNEECKSYIVIETENIEHAKKVLDGLGYSGYYTQINKNKINILDMNVDMRSLAESFFKAGIILTEFSRFNKSLEKYFLEIAGGQKNDQYA